MTNKEILLEMVTHRGKCADGRARFMEMSHANKTPDEMYLQAEPADIDWMTVSIVRTAYMTPQLAEAAKIELLENGDYSYLTQNSQYAGACIRKAFPTLDDYIAAIDPSFFTDYEEMMNENH